MRAAMHQSRLRSRNTDKTVTRAWQRMLSGRRLDLLDPSPLDIEIADIALGLSRVARWNGQSRGEHGFSVAQHAMIVEEIACHVRPELSPEHALMALLHDAPEYVIGDMISPFKSALGLDYKRFEHRLEEAVHIRFGLSSKPPLEIVKLIKLADRACAFFEATQLAGFSEAESHAFFGRPPTGYHIVIEILSPEAARLAFLERFDALYAQHTGIQ